ncbi:MAG: glycoside hydrolase family 127 protein [Verrucomicrobiota bacterium]|nr:glycoside hydrolase family 127 protein [Limisphaera sp.]MDW8380763.1 glycoside hydrolase family 127 protein [Verrucomicrobiota bacterium]
MAEPIEVPWRVPTHVEDQSRLATRERVRIRGWLGTRIHVKVTNRSLSMDPNHLLAGYWRRPSHHPWMGEYTGKWMHASTFAWVHTGNPELRHKIELAAVDLIKSQESDGYWGTYRPDPRFGLSPGCRLGCMASKMQSDRLCSRTIATLAKPRLWRHVKRWLIYSLRH